MTNAEAWFNIALRPRKPEGFLGRTAQDGHLDSHTLHNYQVVTSSHRPVHRGNGRRSAESLQAKPHVLTGDSPWKTFYISTPWGRRWPLQTLPWWRCVPEALSRDCRWSSYARWPHRHPNSKHRSTTATEFTPLGPENCQLTSSFFVCWCSKTSKFVTNNSDKTRRVIYSRQQSLLQHK